MGLKNISTYKENENVELMIWMIKNKSFALIICYVFVIWVIGV